MKLSEITVEEFSTPSPYCIEPNEKLPEIWTLMKKEGIRHALVQANGHFVGIVSERDLTTFSQSPDFDQIEAQDIMSKDVATVPPDTKLYEVALKMSEGKIGSTVVQDVDADYTGIFTATDALNALVEILRGDYGSEDS